MFGHSDLFQYLESATKHDDGYDRANDKVGVTATKNPNKSACRDHTKIGDDVIFGKDQRRTHMDPSIAMFCNERKANDICNQCDDTNPDHERADGVTTKNESSKNVSEYKQGKKHLGKTAEFG